MKTILPQLYSRYDGELRELARKMRDQYFVFVDRGYPPRFSDFEAEVMYMLVREQKPALVFEISPNTGWSTNYLLAALTANGSGELHSFELIEKFGTRPSEEVIRANQHPDWDQKRLHIHIGDATKTAATVTGSIDFALIDSCHDEWFARWYVEHFLPRIKGTAFVQDITFADGLEQSTEASYFWSWLRENRTPVTLLAVEEKKIFDAGLRKGFAERWLRRTNSVVLELPAQTAEEPPRLEPSIPDRIARAAEAFRAGKAAEAESGLADVVFDLMSSPWYGVRHRGMTDAGRVFSLMGKTGEANRCYERAIGLAMLGDRWDRAKGIAEVIEFFAREREFGFMVRAESLLPYNSGAVPKLARRAVVLAGRLFRRGQ